MNQLLTLSGFVSKNDCALMRDSGQLVIRFRRFSKTSQKLKSSFTSCGSLKEYPTTAMSPFPWSGILDVVCAIVITISM